MIDLSHLTEEEKGVIMTVLRRDAELKKAEEERIMKLQSLLDSSSQADYKLKYLTGEWFYEVKSRRHMDKIHGSEIILASMRQRKATSLDGSLKIEKSNKVSSGRDSDIVCPSKPARCYVPMQLQETSDEEKEKLNSAIHSPGRQRHNPFNRASLILVEPSEKTAVVVTAGDQEFSKSSEKEGIPPLKSQAAADSSQTSGGSVTSESSSVGFRPVPKERTFLSKHTYIASESNGFGLDPQTGSEVIVPAPRFSLQRGSSGDSNQSSLKGQEEMSQKTVVTVSQVSQSSQPSSSPDYRNLPAITRDSIVTYTQRDASPEREIQLRREERDEVSQREDAGLHAVTLHTAGIQDSESRNNSSVGTGTRQEELSVTHSTVDPPVSYDLNFIDKTDQPSPIKPNQIHVFKLSPQTSNVTADEEDAIAKVLEWISRSTDSSDWLNIKDSCEVTNSADRHVDRKLLRIAEAENVYEPIVNLQRETCEAKDNVEQIKLRVTGRAANTEVNEIQDEMKKEGERERMRPREEKDNDDESQTLKISHLKSFWEKSSTGPKILISRSNMVNDKEKKPVQLSVDKEEEREVKNFLGISDINAAPGENSEKGSYDTYESNVREREQQLIVRPEKDIGCESVHINVTNNQRSDYSVKMDTNQQQVPGAQMNTDPSYDTDHLKLQSIPQQADRRGSDTEIIPLTRVSPQLRTPFQSGHSPERPNPQTLSHSRESPLQDELSIPTPQIDPELQTKDSPELQTLYLSKTKCQVPSEEAKMRNSEDQSVQSNMSPKRKEETSIKDRTNSPHSQRQNHTQQENTTERIKQLKTFWEQERNKPVFYTGKSKALGDGKAIRGANQTKLNKRFTKSEYDLTSIVSDLGSDGEDSAKNQQNFTVFTMNQRLEKLSPSLSTNRIQFNTLREFWDEATSDSKSSLSFDKPKSPKKKEQIGAQHQPQELKCVDAEFYCTSPTVEKTNTRPVTVKSSPPSRSKLPHDRQMGSVSRAGSDSKSNLSNQMTVELGQQREIRSSKDSSCEEKLTKPQSSEGKETRPHKNKKEGAGNFCGHGNSLRRATSMFALSFPEEKDFSGQSKRDVSPIHSPSRKQSTDRTQNRRHTTEKGATLRRLEENEIPTPLAHAFVPADYRHYLGMTDKSSVHTSLTPALNVDRSEGNPANELDGLVRTSTPVGSEECYGKKSKKACQCPLWVNCSSSDTGQESSVSSTSETWSRNSSNREKNEDQHPVKKALRRAEAWPKNLAKSMEDITKPLSPRQERRQDPTSDLRRISDVSSIPSPSSSFSQHLKKMSKSVPSFLQKEGDGRDIDPACEDTYHQGRLMMGTSVTNLTSSSGLASVSSLSGSVMTMYSGDFGNVDIQGNIQFSINYVQKLREFHIFVATCQDLAAVDPKRGRSDPYVKSYLVPDKANLGKRKTSVKKKTLNPTFNEILRYRVRMEYLRTQTLILSVWHHDTFGRNSFLGEVDVDLSKWDFDHTQMNYLALKARTMPTLVPSNGRGEMRLAIRFMPQIIHSEGLAKDSPSAGEIHIWVKECKNLPLIRPTIDPYVKCFVLPDTSRKSQQKTRVLRRTADPIFNHTMVYDGIREADLTEACVELTVWDRDRLATNMLGGLRLGSGTGNSYGAVVDWMDSTPYEVAMWERMIASPNEWVEELLPLRMLTSAKTTFK
ncbi:hypothetical protein LDENG_00275000 [Lucifuga dentata]|nr:hypothetical protein LDENG_00275000 [Lucifuga dentata]